MTATKSFFLLSLLLLLLPAINVAFQGSVRFCRRSFCRAAARDSDDNAAWDDHGSEKKEYYTLEYSPNFRRHIVRKSGTVVQSFAWFDQALQFFPQAERLALPLSAQGDVLPIAGGGAEDCDYPKNNDLASRRDTNEAEIRDYLGTTLGWYSGQIDAFLEASPFLLVWPVSLLRERIDFLLSPLPGESVVAEVNATVIDWPVQYYAHGRGAGMSVAQLTHALTVMPNLLFREYETDSLRSSVNSERLRRASYLYQETPAVVLELARKQLDALYGASSGDCVSYGYLHWKGWEFHQIRVVLQAFPGSVMCSAETSWELLERGSTRKTLRLDALLYLQYRLQISPSHLQGILKTHPALSHYPKHQLQRNCDALQGKLQLSSNELRTLVLKMPSLLGMSIKSLDERIMFWTDGPGLSLGDLKEASLLVPALLQYGIANNLEPKLRFFQEIGLSSSAIKKITHEKPRTWGRSLTGHLQPLCDCVCSRCNLTRIEFGSLLERTPALAVANVKRNVLVKLDYLSDRLSLSPSDLRSLVQKTPWILNQSLKSKLQPRLDLLEKLSSKRETRQIVLESPSILLLSHARFEKLMGRVRYALLTEGSFSEAMAEAGKAGKRSTKTVCLLATDGESIERRFASVEEAAVYARVSKSHMYAVLRQSRTLNGRSYVMSDMSPDDLVATPRDSRVTASPEAPTADKKAAPKPRNRGVDANDSLTQDLARLVTLEPRPPQKLTIHVSARAFPPEDILRGRRRAGGMALRVPAWTRDDWKKVVPQLWKGQHYRLLRDGHTLLLGYSYIRPSRSRCSLYACREALRAARAWLIENSGALLAQHLEIEIVTDSN